MSAAAAPDCTHCKQIAHTISSEQDTRPACYSCAALIGDLIGKKQMAPDVNVAEVPEANWLSESLVGRSAERNNNIDTAREQVRTGLIVRAHQQGRRPQELLDQYDRMAERLHKIANEGGNSFTKHGVDANTRKINAPKAARALLSLFDKWVIRDEKDINMLRNFYAVVIAVLMSIRKDNLWAARNLFKTVVRPFGNGTALLSLPYLGGIREKIGAEVVAQIEAEVMKLIDEKRRDYDDEDAWNGGKGGDKKRQAPRDPRDPNYNEEEDPLSWLNSDLSPEDQDRKFQAQQRDALSAYNAYGPIDLNANPAVLRLRPLPGDAFGDDESSVFEPAEPGGGGIGGDPDDGGGGGGGGGGDGDDDTSSSTSSDDASDASGDDSSTSGAYDDSDDSDYDDESSASAAAAPPVAPRDRARRTPSGSPFPSPAPAPARAKPLPGYRTGVVDRPVNPDARPLSARRIPQAGTQPARAFTARVPGETRSPGRPKGSVSRRRWTWDYPENLDQSPAAAAAAAAAPPPQPMDARIRLPGTQIGAGGKKFSVAKMRKEMLRYFAAARRGGEYPASYWYAFGKGVADVAVKQYRTQLQTAGQRFGEFIQFLMDTNYKSQKLSLPKLQSAQYEKNMQAFLNDAAYRATPNYAEFFLQIWEMFQHWLRADRDLRTGQKSANQFRVDVSKAFLELYRAVVERVGKTAAAPQTLLDGLFADLLKELQSIAPGYSGARYSASQKSASLQTAGPPPGAQP
jgi:hypothetical protein